MNSFSEYMADRVCDVLALAFLLLVLYTAHKYVHSMEGHHETKEHSREDN